MSLNEFKEFEQYQTFQYYYNSIMNVYNLLQKYLLNYIEINKDYEKKLINLNQKFNFKNLIPNDDIQLKPVFDLSYKIYNLIEENIENFKILNNFLENNYTSKEKFLIENNQNIKNFNKDYLTNKDEFENKFKEINKSKNNFFTSITNYKNFLEKNLYKLKLKEEDEDEKKFIKILKNSEKEYENKINNFKEYENTFELNCIKDIENLKIKLKDVLDDLKNNIVDILVLLKNYYKIPFFQIDDDLKKINDFQISENFLNEISNNFNKKNNKNNKIDIENYSINFLDENKNKYFHADETEKEKDNTNINELYFIMKKITKQTKYINLDNYNMKEEKLKINVKYYSKKILDFSNEKNNISKNEFYTLLKCFKYPVGRKMFLKKLNKFRNLGKFSLPKKVFNLIGKILNKILDYSFIDNDYFSFKNCIILSLTFYKEKDKNSFLIKRISNHKIFKDKQFWENYLEYIIQKEIIESLKNNKKNIGMLIDKDQNENIKRYGKIVFAQLIGFCDNMIDFGFNKEEIKKLIEPKIEYYQMEKTDVQIIYDVLNNKQPYQFEFNDSENEDIFSDEDNSENKKIDDNKQIKEIDNDNNIKNKNNIINKEEEQINNINNNDNLLSNNKKDDEKDFDNEINENNLNNIINEENNNDNLNNNK